MLPAATKKPMEIHPQQLTEIHPQNTIRPQQTTAATIAATIAATTAAAVLGIALANPMLHSSLILFAKLAFPWAAAFSASTCKRVRTRGCGAWTCLAHALQCLCDGHRQRDTVVSTCCFTGMVRFGVKIPQDGNRANR